MQPTLDAARRAAGERLAATSDSPDLDGRLLLAHLLQVDAGYLIAHDRDVLSADVLAHLDALVARRAAGEPLAYIVGHVGFWTLELDVTPDVLVPRPDTETLVGTALEYLDDNAALSVADLGTGSGAIALALAAERPNWSVTATDNSPAALACAAANAQRLGLSRVAFNAGDWFTALGDTRFDAIVSNPPYVAPDDAHLDAPELGHEPVQALVAADAGLADLAALIHGARAHLVDAGWLVLEHGADQGASVRALFSDAGYEEIQTRCDLGGRERVTAGRVSS